WKPAAPDCRRRRKASAPRRRRASREQAAGAGASAVQPASWRRPLARAASVAAAAFVYQAGARHQLVLPVQDDAAVLDGQGQEVEDVAGVHLAGMQRALAGQVERAGDGDALLLEGFARTRELAVAAGFRRQV